MQAGAHAYTMEAGENELRQLAAYLNVEAVSRFSATFAFEPLAADKFRAKGRFEASLTQASVVTLEPVESRISEKFSVEFWPERLVQEFDAQEASIEEERPEAISDGRLEIGRLLSELLLLSVDPYPRNEGDRLEWQAPPVAEDDGPFAELAKLKVAKKP